MSRRPPVAEPSEPRSPTQGEPERIIASLRPHGRAMFWPSLLLIAIAFAVAFFTGGFAEQWQNWAVAAVGAALAILCWLIPLLRWLSRRYIITTRRVVVRGGLVVRSRQELLHSRGYDITVRQGAVQRVVASGDVLINSGLDRPVRLTDVPAAALVQSTLHDLAERSMNPIAARRLTEQSPADNPSDTW